MAPTIYADYGATDQTISVSWGEIPCESRRGPEFHYEFQLIKLATGNVYQQWQTTTQTLALVSGLTGCTAYDFEVRGVNSIGFGDSSTMSVSTAVVGK